VPVKQIPTGAFEGARFPALTYKAKIPTGGAPVVKFDFSSVACPVSPGR